MGIYKILTPVSFVGRDAKRPCFIYSNMLHKWWWFRLSFIIPSRFLCRTCSHINNSSKKTFSTLQSLLQNSIQQIHLLKTIFLHHSIRSGIFLLFDVKDHRKEFLKLVTEGMVKKWDRVPEPVVHHDLQDAAVSSRYLGHRNFTASTIPLQRVLSQTHFKWFFLTRYSGKAGIIPSQKIPQRCT